MEVSSSDAFAESLKVVGFEGCFSPFAGVEHFFGEVGGFFGALGCVGRSKGDGVGFAGD